MIKTARMLDYILMAPPAQFSHVPDEGDFIVSRGFFVGLFLVAIQTHLGVKRPVGQYLKMRVQLLIFCFVMAAVTEIRYPRVGRPSQGIPAKQTFYALPIYIMAGVACESPVCQRKSAR